jgi:fibronectin-binding autotransporter adhesin
MKRSLLSATIFSSAQRSAGALPLAFTLALSGAAHADTIYWDNSGGTVNSWASVANWSTVVGGGTNPAAIPGSSDVATFSATPIQGTNQTIALGGNQSVLGLDFLSGVTGNTTINNSGGSLTIGASGVTNAGSGAVNIGPNIHFAASQSIANNGSGNLAFTNDLRVTGSLTITNNGTGTGWVFFSRGEGDIKIVQDSATSTLRIRESSPNRTGPVEIKKGILNTGNSPTNLGTGTVTLGNAAGGSDAATLELVDNGNVSLGNPIELASNTTGTLTIRLLEDAVAVSHNKTLTGGITGTNSLTIENNGGNHPTGRDTISFTTGAINNAGTLTNIGTGAGDTTINSVIGSNVTGVTQNSTTSTLVLGGTNLYSGPTTVSSGALRLANQNAVQNSTVTMGGGAGAALTFASSVGGNAFTLGGLAASSAGAGYDISLLNNAGSPASIALTVGGNNASTTYAGVLSGTGGSLIKAGSGIVTLTGTNTYTGATTVSAGQLMVNGSSSGSAHTVGNGGTLGGTGTVGALLVQSGGTISPGNSPGILNVSGDTTWLDGGNYNWQVLDVDGAAGTGWDQLAITGALDLASLTAGGFNVNVWSLSSALVNGNAQNFDGIGGVYSWPIATASGGITGFDAGDFTIFTGSNNGTTGFTNDFTGGTFSMSQTGNNLYLNYLGPTPVPEPASAVTVLALFSGAVLQRRKRVVK